VQDSPVNIVAGSSPFRDQKRFWRDTVKRIGTGSGVSNLEPLMSSFMFRHFET
jgi:hypothetical protein